MCLYIHTNKRIKNLTEKRITSYQIVVPLFANPSNFQRFNVDTLLYYVEMFIHKYIRTFNIDDGITHKSAHAYTNNTNTGKPHARTFARTTYVEANEYVRMYVYLSVCLGT